jgi:diketogulonate reductase-like aldo/keto reductase
MELSLTSTRTLSNGVAIPRLGLGTYKAADGFEVEAQIAAALAIGYRGIDTARIYGNEDGVGRAIATSGVPRDELFVATKVWNDDQGYERTLEAFDRSMDRLGLEVVDLYLVHWPQPPLMGDTWRAMEEIYASGRARAIGVCNHLVHHLEEMRGFATVMPMVDQVEHHPGLQQPALREWCASNDIVMQAWAPVMRGRVFGIPELVAIGQAHGKTAAQVSIRWILQHDVVTIPKSVHAERLRENADVFDFELSEDEMRVIDGLDRGERIGPDPDRGPF